MLIKMVTLMAGPGGIRQPGKTYDLPTREAEELIRTRYAIRVSKADAPVEEAPVAAETPAPVLPEQATRRSRTSKAVKTEAKS